MIRSGDRISNSIKTTLMILLALACFGFFAGAVFAQEKDTESGYTDTYRTQDCNFVDEGTASYYILKPGYQMVYEGVEDGKTTLFVHTVTNQTRQFYIPNLGWVSTRIVEEKEWADGLPVEWARTFFALCKETGDLYDFGDEVDIYNEEGTKVISNDGTWHAGQPDKNGLAWPGIMMPGTFILGAKYYQQMAEGASEERAHNWEMGLTVETPAGTFKDVISVRETNWSEPEGAETFKLHAPGIGLIQEDVLKLTAFGYDIFDMKTGKMKPAYRGEIMAIK